ADLARAGAVVRGYDPRVRAPGGVLNADDGQQACQGADLVLSVNSAADALDALAEGLPARAAGLERWLRDDIIGELSRADKSTVDRLVTGSHRHAVRREHEMAAAVDRQPADRA